MTPALPVGASVFIPRGMKSVSIPLKWTADFRLVKEKFQGGRGFGRQSVDSRKQVLILAAASPSNAWFYNHRLSHFFCRLSTITAYSNAHLSTRVLRSTGHQNLAPYTYTASCEQLRAACGAVFAWQLCSLSTRRALKNCPSSQSQPDC